MRFYYADDAAPVTGGSPMDIAAAALAKSGIQTDAEHESVEIPNIVTDQKTEPPPPTETAKAETAPVVKKDEAQIAETAASVVETHTQQSDWKAELQKAEKAEILKELGFDEKMLGFYNTWTAGGDLGNYIKAISMDYSKMSPEQLLKQQIADEYPEFSPEDLDELYHAKVIDQYKLDPEVYSETEVKRGKLLLAADAKKVRESMIARQKDFLLSAKPPELPDYRKEVEEREKAQEVANAATVEQYASSLTSQSATKELLTNKRLTIGEGEDQFNYEISDPAKAVAMLKDNRLFAQSIFNADGTFDADKHLFLAAAAMDHKALAREIFKAGKAVGGKQAIEQIENAKKPDAKPSGAEVPLTPAQALARNGVLTNMG